MSSSSSPPPSSSLSPPEPPTTTTTTTTSSENRNTEIWSTRLQRELLAMTTDNASEGAKKEINTVLPSFCVVKDHSLDIERGNCTVTCVLNCVPNLHIFNAPPNSSDSTAGTEKKNDEEGDKNTTNESKSEEGEVKNNDSIRYRSEILGNITTKT